MAALAMSPRVTRLLGPSFRNVTWAVWAVVVVYAFERVFHGAFVRWDRYGSHDWDVHAAYRYITVLALKQGEMPWFSPWFCHGFPAWSYVEGATNVLSPFFPLYLVLPLNVALRLEAIGSCLIALTGAFMLARRFTRSIALATFAAFMFVLNNKWALHFMVGHTWYFQYAWLPWILFFFDKSCREGTKWHAVIAGVMAGLMVTMGGIYPAPHTALALGVYGLALVINERSLRPIGRGLIAGAVALGFSAPKLIPTMTLMRRFPRLVDSGEALNLDQFISVLTSTKEIPTPVWYWHEYGSYIGVAPFALMVIAILLPSPKRTRVFRVLGVLFMLLAMGAFHRFAPWTQLHGIPPFSSQHVPSRFMQVGLLFLGIDVAVTFSALFDRVFARFPLLEKTYAVFDAALLATVVFVCQPMFEVSRATIDSTFTRIMMPVHRAEHFQHTGRIYGLDYVPHHVDGAILPPMMANSGTDEECHSVPYPEQGTVKREAPGYRGEAYFLGGGSAKAVVTYFSPSAAEIEYAGAQPGDLLVYNMNFHPGWTANGEPALDLGHAPAFRVDAPSGKVRFQYRPPGLGLGLLIGGVFVAALAFAWNRRRKAIAYQRALSRVTAH